MEEDYKALMIQRIDKRKTNFLAQYERIKRWIEKGKIGGEANRLWMEEQIKGLKRGVDVCCGDMPIDGAYGVDGTDGVSVSNLLGPVYYTYGDELSNFQYEELDFVVSNYVEAFPNISKVFHEWYRVLKPGGMLAFCCANADKYPDILGPFCNPRRLSIFTPKTAKQYLTRAQFKNVTVEDGEAVSMRVKAYK